MATTARKAAPKKKAAPVVAADTAVNLVEYNMHPFVQATLGERALKVSRAYPDGSQFFIGQTADEEGRVGIALCEAKPDGTLVKHFGSRAQLNAILDAHA